jgi:hypothetical protein
MSRTNFAAALALLIVLFRCLPAAAGQSLEAIRFEPVSPNEERVVFRMTGPPVKPNSFPMKDGSPRLVFDFNGVSVSKRIRNNAETGGKLVGRIRVGIHENKARVVLDLVPGRQVRSVQEADPVSSTLTIIVHDARVQPELRKPVATANATPTGRNSMIWSPEKTSAVQSADKQTEEKPSQSAAVTQPGKQVTAAAAPSAVKPPSPADTVLSSVLFEKNSNRGEMVMFRLNKFHPPVVFGLEEKKPRVVCDFQDTAAAERLPENISADGKYVRGIRIERDEAGRKIRAVLDLAPNNSYDLQQVFFKNDNLFVLIINTLGSPAKQLN